MNNRRKAAWAGAATALAGVAAVTILLNGGTPTDTSDGRADRQRQVAERGRDVMPFDLEATTHHFTPTGTGGVQDVVADRPGDAEEIALIRTHLQEEAEAFRRGDFGDPARIHGDDMPGLAELESGHEDFQVRYEERADGATLTYTAEEPHLVQALHDWFEAQLGDHGSHAESGH
jgi:hypothetical protein